jgi:glycosyltransferase involved in cell wall biosynthesis
MKLISVVSPCYNEEHNVEPLYRRVKAVFDKLGKYRFEMIFIDNASTDNTVGVLKKLAAEDKNVKVIVNTRNFGYIRSPHHGLLNAFGDAVILMASDLEDPPELLEEFIGQWENGYKVVMGVKSSSEESWAMYTIRQAYYRLISRLSQVALVPNFIGFGLYDKQVMDELRKIDDPYPYFRGLIPDLGFEAAKIEYMRKLRRRGITKSNFYSLYDLAMLGITSHSKVPLRIATMAGFFFSVISLLVGLGYLIAKLIFWDTFPMGIAPIVIGIFFSFSIQLFFLGLIGEYIIAIHTQVMKRPLVIERERINFEN